MKRLYDLIRELPDELVEEGTTGRDLIESIIYQAKVDGIIGYIGIDQYNNHYHIKSHPRKELLEQLGTTHADKMYVDLSGGGVREKGYIISGHWIDVYQIHNWK